MFGSPFFIPDAPVSHFHHTPDYGHRKVKEIKFIGIHQTQLILCFSLPDISPEVVTYLCLLPLHSTCSYCFSTFQKVLCAASLISLDIREQSAIVPSKSRFLKCLFHPGLFLLLAGAHYLNQCDSNARNLSTSI